MGITINDLKRAIQNEGDISAFTGFWKKALGNVPVPVRASLIEPTPLPEPEILLKQLKPGLVPLLESWAKREDRKKLPQSKADITFIALPLQGKQVAAFLERTISETNPDVVVIDASPLTLSAHMLYTFSLSAALGLPLHGEIMAENRSDFYTTEDFYPGNIHQTAILTSWRNKIPLLAAGIPRKMVEVDYGLMWTTADPLEQELSKNSMANASHALDLQLGDATTLKDGLAAMRAISDKFSRNISSSYREEVASEACYLASRIAETASLLNSTGEEPRILCITGINHFIDIEYIADLMLKGITDEIYQRPKKDNMQSPVVLSGQLTEKINLEAKYYTPQTTSLQQLFQKKFNRRITALDNTTISEAKLNRLIPRIVNRTRNHQDIVHGASVRGSIAMKEVLQGLATIRNRITRPIILRAAEITLPPRITVKPETDKMAVIDDITREILYNISFSPQEAEIGTFKAIDWLSPADIVKSLKDLKPMEAPQNMKNGQRQPPTVINNNQENQKLLDYLKSRKLLKKGANNQYSLTNKALDYLTEELERKLRDGEINLDDYNLEKARLSKMRNQSKKAQFRMSAKDLASTIMEMMDAQDKQWNQQLSFERMHIYYHIKANSEHQQLSQQKKDYYGLKTLIDGLEEQGILSAADVSSGFSLTGQALEVLLDYIIPRDPKGKGIKGTISYGKTQVNERRFEVRKYTSGDVFRDISVRHTLKEIARQRKQLGHVKAGDFRVFLKERRQLQADIVLCIDTSGSMGFQHKLMYARLAASGLVKAAMKNGDRIGLVAFNNSGQTSMPLTGDDGNEIMNYIVGLSARGNTNIGDGIRCATDLLFQESSHNQKFIVLITDGQPTAISENAFSQLQGKRTEDKDLTEESAILETRKAAARGIKTSVIHVASQLEESDEFIKLIARSGKGQIRRMSNPEDLEAIIR